MSKDLEGRLLASVPTIGHFQALEEQGISIDSFKFYGPMYRYMNDIIKDHNHLPRLIDLRATFNIPDHVQRKPEEYQWLLEEFLSLSIIERIQGVMDSDIEKFGDTPRELLPALIKDLTSLSIPSQHSASVTDTSALSRIQKYEDKITDEMITGIPTGIRYFDADYGLGWMPGELIGIIGRIYIGKTWLLLYHGVIAWLARKRVLFISPEMPEEEAECRIDTVICGQLGVNINVNDLYRGYKPNEEQKNIFKMMAERGDWITLCSDEGRPFSLGQMLRYVKQFSPDILLIDGLLLVGTERRGSSGWEQAKDLSYGLKNLAVGSNISIIVAHQANRNARDTGKPPSLDEIYMGDSLGQAADRIVVLSQPKKDNSLKVTIQKFRKGKPDHQGGNFDFDPERGIIREQELSDNLSEVAEKIKEEDLLPIV